MPFPRYIVVVTLDCLQFRVEGRHVAGIPDRRGDLFHHQVTAQPRIVLGPFHSFHIVIKMFRVLRKISQVDVRQIYEELLHVLAGDIDEVAPHAITDSTRSAMEHKPYSLGLVQADLDEAVAGSERPEEVSVIAAIQLRMLSQDRVIASLQLATPDLLVALRNVMPCAAIASSAVIRPAVRHGCFNGYANSLQVIREVARIET